ncbi:hypothetical protein FNF27_01975 [Cafeteria roenbergensis]|uniref:EGF-like domain-containing protein n=1 Tax=Cafeteria roenbergensis TaxID=33653 RepID=A0A5A8EHD5_CAFRO|nr:hypothetical protein FNF27_01975 [Cafeteria roenbergensis]
MRRCPRDVAWSDVTLPDGTAHNVAECSNRGTCDYTTGKCACDALFEGKACQRLKCAEDCGDAGICQSLHTRSEELEASEGLFHYWSPWDAEKVFGCSCDQGHAGYACQHLACSRGTDPMTEAQAWPTIVLRCDYDPQSSPDVAFRLSRGGKHSGIVRASSTAHDLRQQLEAMPGLGRVEVRIDSKSGNLSTVCGAPQGNGKSEGVVVIGLRDRPRDSPPLLLKHADGRQLDGTLANKIVTATRGEGLVRGGDSDAYVVVSNTGTVESVPCSGRGFCEETGQCMCAEGFGSSDGHGASGSRPDCGFAIGGKDQVAACPRSTLHSEVPCSGHGRCTGMPSWRCECDDGWMGPDCSIRGCPWGRSWFDVPVIGPNVAHQPSECSDMGTCDRLTGQCDCREGFGGSACEVMECPGTRATEEAGRVADKEGRKQVAAPCSGHGQCLTMRRLADFATDNGVPVSVAYGEDRGDPHQWDSTSVRGCKCDDGWEGHDCGRRSCPRGNDPANDGSPGSGQNNEEQSLQCIFVSGNPAFRLAFRGESSQLIPHTASEAQVKGALEAMGTIGRVEVSFGGAAQACTTGDGTAIVIHFETEHGDLPNVTAVSQDDLTAGVLKINATATELVRGTTETAECNDRGLCDYGMGQCVCFPGWGSSDGTNRPGVTGDCGYRVPYSLPKDRQAAWLRRRRQVGMEE